MYYLVGAGLGAITCVTVLGLLYRNADCGLPLILLVATGSGTPWGILLGLTTAKMIKKESAVVLQNKSTLSILVLLYFIAGIIGSVGAYVLLSPFVEVPGPCMPDTLWAFLGGILSILLVRKIRTHFWHNVPTDRSA